jgi:hypothetical protein
MRGRNDRMSDSESQKRFQARLESMNRSWRGTEHTAEAAAYVHDTLELAWLAATDLFGDKATADIAVALYDRIDEERLRRADEDAKTRAALAEGPDSHR